MHAASDQILDGRKAWEQGRSNTPELHRYLLYYYVREILRMLPNPKHEVLGLPDHNVLLFICYLFVHCRKTEEGSPPAEDAGTDKPVIYSPNWSGYLFRLKTYVFVGCNSSNTYT